MAYAVAGLGTYQVVGGIRSTLADHLPLIPQCRYPGDMADVVGTALGKSEQQRQEVARATAAVAMTRHTYVNRVEQLIKEMTP